MILDRSYAYQLRISAEDNALFLNSIIMGVQNVVVKNEYSNILFCALQKSGSMHLSHLLSLSLGYENHQIGFNLAGGNIYYPRLLATKFLKRNTISHCHAELNRHSLEVIENLDLKLIVNTRNLLDALLSRHDRMQIQNPLNPLDGYDKYIEGDEEYKLDAAIELYANDYIRFFTGWEVYDGEVIRTTYEEMLADEVGLVHRVADELGAPVVGDVANISREMKEAGGINLNKGIYGRGREAFNDRQKKEIRRRADILGCYDEEFLDG